MDVLMDMDSQCRGSQMKVDFVSKRVTCIRDFNIAHYMLNAYYSMP